MATGHARQWIPATHAASEPLMSRLWCATVRLLEGVFQPRQTRHIDIIYSTSMHDDGRPRLGFTGSGDGGWSMRCKGGCFFRPFRLYYISIFF